MRRSLLAMTLSLLLAGTTSSADESPSTLMEHGQMRRAAAAAETRLKSNPNDAEALRVLAMIRAVQRRFDEATDLGERAVAAAPKDPDAHCAMAQVAGMHAQAASMLKKPGLAKRFKKEAEAALAINPNHEDAIENMIGFHRRAPGIMGGDKKKGAEFLDQLMKINPTSAWLVKADVADEDKDSVLAEKCLRQAVGAKGEPRAKASLAVWQIRPWRNPDEAERLAREAVESEPWRTGGWVIIAVRQAQRKQWPEMEQTLAKAEAATGSLGPHYQVARVLVTENLDPARAEALLRRYLTVEPEIGGPSYAGAHWRLGQALEKQGKKSEAIAELQTASKLDPKLDGPKKDLKRLKG